MFLTVIANESANIRLLSLEIMRQLGFGTTVIFEMGGISIILPDQLDHNNAIEIIKPIPGVKSVHVFEGEPEFTE